jgi:hypothetical protein
MTVLDDGRVLLTGNGADYYDPATGSFSAAAPMVNDSHQTAVKLADGRVLLLGGSDTDLHYMASAEIYDPVTAKFSATGSMKTAREYAQAVLLPDHRVLVVGGDQGQGQNEPNHILASAEIYDPATGKFTPTASMHFPRTQCTATLLPNGKVLVAGGFNNEGSNGNTLASAELYDPIAATWTMTGSMSKERMANSAVLLQTGQVLVVGADEMPDLYDPASGMFRYTGSIPPLGDYPVRVLLHDGRVYFPGDPMELHPSFLYWP